MVNYMQNLPASLDAERYSLGSILLDDSTYPEAAGAIKAEDFSLERHRRIFLRMGELYERGEHIDRATLAEELQRRGELESVGGLGYIIDLDDDLPQILHLDSYLRIVQEKATLRKCIESCDGLIKRCMMAEEDSSTIIGEAEAMLVALSERQHKHGQWMRPGDVMAQFPGGINAFMDQPRGGTGIQTPWPDLTEKLCGLHSGDLFVVAGRPSMGKSIVAVQMAHHAAKTNHGAAVFSLEMSKESIVHRLIANVARVDAQKLRAGFLSRDERARALSAGSDISRLPLFIDDTRARTIPAITAAIRKLLAHEKVALVIVDHLQLMRSSKRTENRHQELADICHSMKHIAGDVDVNLMLVSQLNRQCEIDNRRPQLSDLAETGSLEQDADVVMFIHRPERYARNHGKEELRGRAEFIVAKQRNGPSGMKNMTFLDSLQKFECQSGDIGFEPVEEGAA